MRIFNIAIDPIAKPRMTASDKWKKRQCVVNYRAFADELRLLVKEVGFKPTERLSVTFYIPMPDSWSEKKKNEFGHKPHQLKPDIDNLVKAVMDILYETDQHVWEIEAKKIWSHEGFIVFGELK